MSACICNETEIEAEPSSMNLITTNVKKNKKKSAEYVMPTRENYSVLLSANYTVRQLKEIATHHKIKLGGANIKTDIVTKIYNFFKLHDNVVVIQKAWRRYLFKEYNKLRGPARFSRKLCVNDTDFFTMDNISEIPYLQFYSFKDVDNTIYGFDIMSIYNLFNRDYDKISNPYNRNMFPKKVKKNMLKIIWLSKLFNDTLNLKMNDDITSEPVSPSHPNIDNRVMSVFHDIDILGNYTNLNWFLNLSTAALMRFLFELNDIWSYRANLLDSIKREICPNYQDLFRMMHLVDIRLVTLPILQEIALGVIEKLVRNGINHDSRCLGANYVLCALTLVSPDAAIALPWLYQSVF